MKIFLLLIFVASASGIFITCRFNFDKNWNVIGSTYTCQVTSMDFSDNSTHITGYNGKHLSGNSSTNVGMISFDLNCPQFNLTTIPKGFSNFFPNLIGFRFDSCSISSLNGDELNEYPNLQYFDTFISKLTRVPGIFFSSTPNMKYVFFGANKIQHVGEGLLDILQNLQQAFFTNNICINKYASNPSQIPALIEALRQNCADIEQETTTQLTTTNISTSSTTNQPPRCEIDDFEDFVCGLDEEIENLKEKDEKLQAQVENLSVENLKLEENNENLQNMVENLKSQVEDFNSKNEEMRRELANQAEAFSQLEQLVIYLSTRPN